MKFNFGIHNIPALDSMLKQFNPIHCLTLFPSDTF